MLNHETNITQLHTWVSFLYHHFHDIATSNWFQDNLLDYYWTGVSISGSPPINELGDSSGVENNLRLVELSPISDYLGSLMNIIETCKSCFFCCLSPFWLVVYLPLWKKKWNSSPNIWKNNPFMFQSPPTSIICHQSSCRRQGALKTSRACCHCQAFWHAEIKALKLTTSGVAWNLATFRHWKPNEDLNRASVCCEPRGESPKKPWVSHVWRKLPWSYFGWSSRSRTISDDLFETSRGFLVSWRANICLHQLSQPGT